MGAIGIAVLLSLLVGVPVGIAFWLPTVMGASAANVDPTMIAATVPMQTVTGFALLAIPYFILAGQIMNDGGLVTRIVNFAQLLLGWLKGAIGYVVIAASALFGATTGSSVATVATISTSMGDEMVSKGYKRDYVASLIAASGLLGVLIPPSIPMIIFASVVGLSVGELFLAILLPGLVFVLGFMGMHAFSSRSARTSEETAEGADLEHHPLATGRTTTGLLQLERHTPVKEKPKPIKVVIQAIPPLMMPVIMLGGIYSGILTPTEAAAAGAVYGLVLALVTRGLKINMLGGTFLKAAIPSAAILTILALSSVFNRIITLERIPQMISDWALTITESQVVFLLLLLLVTLAVGMFMETNAAILIMAPLLYPAALAFDVNPIHFGVILVTSLELGMITPPMALNIFVSAKSNKASLVRMMPYVMRFVILSFVLLLIITFTPWLTTWHL